MQDEINIIKEYDKTYDFINDILDNNLKNINEDIETLIQKFEESVIKWLSKTSHNKHTIYTDFIKKIQNSEWLTTNKKIILKYIDSDENKRNFVEKWNNNEQIREAYSDIFVYIKKSDNESESKSKN